MVNQTNGTAKVNFRLRALAHQVQHGLARFQYIKIENVPREQNQAADFLSTLRTKGEEPLINHPVKGWDKAETLLQFLHAEYQRPP